jgi:enoyl-CoA hydratase
VTLNRPEKRNALNVALLAGLAQACEAAAADNGVRCLILAAAGPVFCAGADIAEMRAGGVEVLRRPERARHWSTIEHFAKPLLAAVEGAALGGGNELVMLADIVIAGKEARFGQPEVKIGGMPGDGGTQRLVRAVGKNLAMKMILTGKPIDADTAMHAGLVAETVESGQALARAIELAADIAASAPLAIAAAKQCILRAFESGLSDGLNVERQTMFRLAQSKDWAEGQAAFLERRAPQFIGE